MKTTQGDIVGMLGNFIDEMMLGIERDENILTGDISPVQCRELDDHVDGIAAILYAVLMQNQTH